MTTQTENHAEAQAKAQYESIRGMVERLEHAQSCRWDGDWEDCEGDKDAIAEFMQDFQIDLEDYHDEDKAKELIQEDPLSVLVRSGWYEPLGQRSPDPATEFEILLCTGGPAVRIMGALGFVGNDPSRAWLEHQDWGTPWTQWFGASQDVLLAYAREFYYGS